MSEYDPIISDARACFFDIDCLQSLPNQDDLFIQKLIAAEECISHAPAYPQFGGVDSVISIAGERGKKIKRCYAVQISDSSGDLKGGLKEARVERTHAEFEVAQRLLIDKGSGFRGEDDFFAPPTTTTFDTWTPDGRADTYKVLYEETHRKTYSHYIWPPVLVLGSIGAIRVGKLGDRLGTRLMSIQVWAILKDENVARRAIREARGLTLLGGVCGFMIGGVIALGVAYGIYGFFGPSNRPKVLERQGITFKP